MTATAIEPATTHTQVMARCPLSPIELALVRHLADGDLRRAAARKVGLSPKSIETTISRIFTKTNTVNAPNLVATALRKGWIR